MLLQKVSPCALRLRLGSVHIRVALQSDDRVLKTKRTKTVRRSLEQPYFKQSFEFVLDEHMRSDSNDERISEREERKHPVDKFCLAFYVCANRSNRLQVATRHVTTSSSHGYLSVQFLHGSVAIMLNLFCIRDCEVSHFRAALPPSLMRFWVAIKFLLT